MAGTIKLPGVRKPPFYARELWPNLLGMGSVGAAIGAAAKISEHGWVFWLIVIAAVLTTFQITLKIVAAVHKDREAAREKSPLDLTACLHVLHSVLIQQGPRLGVNDNLRLTIYRLDRDELEQVVPYIGGRGGPAGRRLSIRTGIIGRAVRVGDPHVLASRKNADPQSFIREMVRDWGFSEDEARSLSADRFAWMAIPVRAETNGQVIGVVFLDCSSPDFFSQVVQELAIAACSGLSKYATQHYG